MSETSGTKRLNVVVKELNVGMTTLVDFLAKKGHVIEAKPTTKLTEEQYVTLLSEFSSEKKVKQEANKLGKDRLKPKDVVHEIAKPKPLMVEEEEEEDGILIKSELVNKGIKAEPEKTEEKKVELPAQVEEISPVIPEEQPEKTSSNDDLPKFKVIGKIELLGKKPKAKKT